MDFIKPRRISEANIQAELYKQLKELEINCYLEYKHERSRFDLIILDIDLKNIIGIIEVKSKTRNTEITGKKQHCKYLQYGIPVIYCINYTGIPKAIEDIKSLFKVGVAG